MMKKQSNKRWTKSRAARLQKLTREMIAREGESAFRGMAFLCEVTAAAKMGRASRAVSESDEAGSG